MANEENQFFSIMIQPWKADGALEISPFSASSTVPREEGKMAFPRQPFSLFFFLISFNSSGVVLADLSLVIKWAGLPFLFWVLDLADGFLAISFHVLSTVDYWACWALDPWWITEMLDLVYRGPKKWAFTFSPLSPNRM